MWIARNWDLIFLVLVYSSLYFIFRPIAKKAGYSGWWGLIVLIPFVNIVVLWVFALVTWPAQRRISPASMD